MDQAVATFFGSEDMYLLIVGFFTLTLPYIHFDRELAAFPYLTRDFMNEMYEERRNTLTLKGKAVVTI